MGRARVTLKPISNERIRKTTFIRRKKGLINKMSEFSTLCGVDACLIMYDEANGDVGPETWPRDPALVRSIIENYESQKNEKPPKTFDIQDFFENRKNMIEAETSKVHKKSIDIKYPTWNPSFSNMEEAQLRDFIAVVDAKMRACDQRISMLKNMHQNEANLRFMQQHMAQANGSSSSHSNQLNFMQNISQSQIVSTPMQPLLYEHNGRLNFTYSTNHVGGPSSNNGINMLTNMQQGNTSFSHIPSMPMERATSSHPSQLNCIQNNSTSQFTPETLKQVREDNHKLHFNNEVWDVPLDSTNQLVESLDWSNQIAGWDIGSLELEDLSKQLGDDDLADLVSEPILHDIPVQYQNELQGIAFPALPPVNGFHTDYNNSVA